MKIYTNVTYIDINLASYTTYYPLMQALLLENGPLAHGNFQVYEFMFQCPCIWTPNETLNRSFPLASAPPANPHLYMVLCRSYLFFRKLHMNV